MRHQIALGFATLVGVCALLWPAPAMAQDAGPGDLAERCIQDVTYLANQCVRRNRATATRCVAAIEQLLADGQVDEAKQTARRCIRRINRRSAACVEAIKEHCQRCVHELRALGAFELAEHVERVCRRAIRRVRRSQHVAVQSIREALEAGLAASVE